MQHANRRAAWVAADLRTDASWVFGLDARARDALTQTVRRAMQPGKPLLAYQPSDVDLGPAREIIAAAFQEVRDGRGMALVRGLPREGLSADEFEWLTWAIGLHFGVARPQGKASQYLSAVRDVGTTYRTGKGRGYSSNAELDFHTDSADVVVLSCYNVAKSGGMSMVSSSVTAHEVIEAERPDLANTLHQPHYFSRQQEQAPNEAPYYANPVYDWQDGLLFSKWNRNRLRSAQAIQGVPRLSAMQHEALDLLDDVLRRPALMYAMHLQPGDMQILNSHVTLHSRTEFEDFEDPALKRCLFRLWLAPPDGVTLPESWKPAFKSVAPGTVRGGIVGQAYDEACRAFEARQANALGMTMAEVS